MDHNHLRRLHGKGSGPWQPVTYWITLIAKSEIADNTWQFVFEKPTDFHYRAGQHVRMTLNGDHRFWSFASAPCEPDLAFAIRLRPSRFKQALADLPLGAQVRIDMLANPPKGAFALDPTDVRPAVFLAGGIGVAPAFSMIKQALNDTPARTLALFYANRRPQDAPFLAELQALAGNHPNFHFIPTMTGSTPDWSGETGRIDLAMLERHLSDLKSLAWYIAGLSPMVRDLKAALAYAAVPKSALHTEEFGSFNSSKPPPKSRLPLLLLALVVAAAVAIHALPVTLILRSTHPTLSWSNPAVWISVAIATLILIKLALLSRLRSK